MSLWHPSIVVRRSSEGVGYASDYVRVPGQPEEEQKGDFTLPKRPLGEYPPHPALAQAFLGFEDSKLT